MWFIWLCLANLWLWVRKRRWTQRSLLGSLHSECFCGNMQKLCVNLYVLHMQNSKQNTIRRVEFENLKQRKSPHSCLVYLRNSLRLALINKNRHTASEWCGIPCEPTKQAATTPREQHEHDDDYTYWFTLFYYYYRFYCVENKMAFPCEFSVAFGIL